MSADLHLHTYFSDGTYSPEEVAELAKKNNLRADALTDHDTMEGGPRMAAACQALGVEFIPATELTAEIGGHEIHFLGYFLDSANETLLRELGFPADDEGASIKDLKFSETCMRADAFVLVVPEYNHGYPGLLKHALDTNLAEYIHKAVGICGVSAGPFGGTRVVENLLPVMRELGLVTIFWDGNFSTVQNAFDASGALVETAYVRRLDKFFKELIWMARVLRHGRESVQLDEE